MDQIPLLLQKIPLPVLYTGLGAFFLAPIIAGLLYRSTTVTFMLYLRLAIGWHFLFEGLHKIHLEYLGVTETSKPFNSAVYFENSEGPLAPVMRKYIGDQDEKLLERLKAAKDEAPPKDLLEGWKSYFETQKLIAAMPTSNAEDKKKKAEAESKQKEALDKLNIYPEMLPASIYEEWTGYANRFKAKFELTEDESKKLDDKMKLASGDYMVWLNVKRIVTKNSPGGGTPADVEETVAKSAEEFKKKIDERNAAVALPHKSSDLGESSVDRDKIAAIQADIRKLRGDLKKEVDEKTTKLKESLASLAKNKVADARETTLADEQKHDHLYILNFATRWGLTAIGIGLLAGTFTRLAALGGALFLLSTYLVDSPLPWLPVSPKSEGNYLFVNKNLVEMLALLTILTTASGRWMGLDALLCRTKFWVRALIFLALAGVFFWLVAWPAFR